MYKIIVKKHPDTHGFIPDFRNLGDVIEVESLDDEIELSDGGSYIFTVRKSELDEMGVPVYYFTGDIYMRYLRSSID